MAVKRALVPLAPGFEELEAVTIIDVLRRGGVEVIVAGLGGMVVEGSHGIRIEANITLESLSAAPALWDAIVLPGGMPGAEHLRDSKPLRALLQTNAQAGRLIAAVCAAPIALEAAGLLAGKRATSYPSFRPHLKSARVSDEVVVEDGNIVTSQGPGTALRFALALVRRLIGPEAAAQLEKGMLVTS